MQSGRRNVIAQILPMYKLTELHLLDQDAFPSQFEAKTKEICRTFRKGSMCHLLLPFFNLSIATLFFQPILLLIGRKFVPAKKIPEDWEEILDLVAPPPPPPVTGRKDTSRHVHSN